jgi:acrylyl-CoA reductase (NADPH)
MTDFNAIVVNKTDTAYSAAVQKMTIQELPRLPEAADTAEGVRGNVLVKIDYATINYKDGLAITGKSPIIRKFPAIPGIDFAGTVEDSSHPDWKKGDAVILNGWGVGETHWGGLAQYARVNGDWLIARPKQFSSRQAMAIGTAGYTAMLCIMAIEKHGVTPAQGEVLVTGAAGGVGSIAVAVLAKMGFTVVASTGRPAEAAYLKQLGAAAVMDRTELSAPGKPLAKERWAAVVDSVGSHTLANACAATKSEGAVAACGLAQGMDFPATVAPFILRGITLYGINSVTAPKARREAAWSALVQRLDPHLLDAMTQEISLAEAIPAAQEILAGHIRGRLVVDVNR